VSQFSGKVAVITGGASGIGRGIARKLVAEGGAVVLADLDAERLASVASEFGEVVLTVTCDVADLAAVEALAEQAFAWRGHIDLVLNNAGVGGPPGKLWDIAPEAARRHFDINYWGVWNGCKAFAPRLAAQERDSALYNTASENALFCAGPRMGTYIAAKHAVLGLTESLREDVPPHVHVGTMFPGWVHTAIGPENFMQFGMDADRFAGIVVPQLLARKRFVVSHYSNVRRVKERIDPLLETYETSAERDEMDVRDWIEAMRKR
jgi:NAD(P)-dependent dehydrogenase (short-subunit alcohol dehydrogenase family)